MNNKKSSFYGIVKRKFAGASQNNNNDESGASFVELPRTAYVEGTEDSGRENRLPAFMIDEYPELPASSKGSRMPRTSTPRTKRSVHFSDSEDDLSEGEIVSDVEYDPSRYETATQTEQSTADLRDMGKRILEQMKSVNEQLKKTTSSITKPKDVQGDRSFLEPTAPYISDVGVSRPRARSLSPRKVKDFSGVRKVVNGDFGVSSGGNAQALLQQAFVRSQKPKLPSFDEKNLESWLSVCEKRLRDFQIYDPVLKYQLLTSAFNTSQLNKLEPFLSVGEKEEHYANLIRGLQRIYGKTKEERMSKALNMRYDGKDLPSTLASSMKVLLADQGFDDKVLRTMVSMKLPSSLRRHLVPYQDKDLKTYLNIADKFFICDRGGKGMVGLIQEEEAEEDKLSKADLAVLQILVNLQDTMKQQTSNSNKLMALVEEKKKKQEITENKNKNKPVVIKNGNTNRGQSRPRIQPTDFTNICRNHQNWGRKCNACAPGCKWGQSHFCQRHFRFGINAWDCEAPCQWKSLVKKSNSGN